MYLAKYHRAPGKILDSRMLRMLILPQRDTTTEMVLVNVLWKDPCEGYNSRKARPPHRRAQKASLVK